MTSFFNLFGKKTAPDPQQKSESKQIDVAATPVPTRHFPSPLLREVLKSKFAQPTPSSDGVAENDPVDATTQRLNIGVVLAQAKAIIISEAEALATVVDVETADIIGARIESLKQKVCRIAVVGQMNAGKSSLINVIVDQSGLLPADINPWTTVVTNLNFGVHGKPTSGASFSFFSADEWERLSAGGRIREITERTFPEFDWAILNDQVYAMRTRAEKKLGSRFESLLGAKHDFPELTPGLLNRYVGAGATDLPDALSSTDGEFSDITKLANVYFDLGPFDFPAVVVDTPGVNDPTLVRDEITRQNLETADVCVIVLTARQLLSNADLNLLRMLKGLNKNRLLIFVNKIDEIEQAHLNVDDLAKSIRAVLNQEVPGCDIPILFGSALWALAARTRTSSTVSTPLDVDPGEQLNTEARSNIPWQAADILDIINAEALMQKSGIPNLALAVSELMQRGVTAEIIDQTANFLDAIGVNNVACASLGVDILSRYQENSVDAQNHVTSLCTLTEALSKVFHEAERRFIILCTEQTNLLREKLLTSLRDDASVYSTNFSNGANDTQIAQLDLSLRIRLEGVFSHVFEQAIQALRADKIALNSEIDASLNLSGLREKLPIADVARAFHIELASTAALSEPASLGLTTDAIERSAKSMQRTDAQSFLAGVIYADFEPIVEKLTFEARRALTATSFSMLQETKILALQPLQIMTAWVVSAFEKIQLGATAHPENHAQRQNDLKDQLQLKQAEIAVLTKVIMSLKAAAIKKTSPH